MSCVFFCVRLPALSCLWGCSSFLLKVFHCVTLSQCVYPAADGQFGLFSNSDHFWEEGSRVPTCLLHFYALPLGGPCRGMAGSGRLVDSARLFSWVVVLIYTCSSYALILSCFPFWPFSPHGGSVVVLIHITSMVWEAEYLVVDLLAIWMSSCGIFGQFLHWVVCLFLMDSQKFFTYSGYKPFVFDMLYGGSPFLSPTGVLWWVEVPNFNVIQHISPIFMLVLFIWSLSPLRSWRYFSNVLWPEAFLFCLSHVDCDPPGIDFCVWCEVGGQDSWFSP